MGDLQKYAEYKNPDHREYISVHFCNTVGNVDLCIPGREGKGSKDYKGAEETFKQSLFSYKFITLNLVALWIYPYVKAYQIVYFMCNLCELCLKAIVFKQPRENVGCLQPTVGDTLICFSLVGLVV